MKANTVYYVEFIVCERVQMSLAFSKILQQNESCESHKLPYQAKNGMKGFGLSRQAFQVAQKVPVRKSPLLLVNHSGRFVQFRTRIGAYPLAVFRQVLEQSQVHPQPSPWSIHEIQRVREAFRGILRPLLELQELILGIHQRLVLIEVDFLQESISHSLQEIPLVHNDTITKAG